SAETVVAADTSTDAAYGDKVPSTNPADKRDALFVDWPKPQVALVFSGEQDGYLEPCGCAGLHNQKGGLKRRMTLLEQLRGEGWPVVALDAGGLTKRSGPQEEIKMRRMLESFVDLGYQVAGLGTPE